MEKNEKEFSFCYIVENNDVFFTKDSESDDVLFKTYFNIITFTWSSFLIFLVFEALLSMLECE